jgi:hypothetical protein
MRIGVSGQLEKTILDINNKHKLSFVSSPVPMWLHTSCITYRVLSVQPLVGVLYKTRSTFGQNIWESGSILFCSWANAVATRALKAKLRNFILKVDFCDQRTKIGEEENDVQSAGSGSDG